MPSSQIQSIFLIIPMKTSCCSLATLLAVLSIAGLALTDAAQAKPVTVGKKPAKTAAKTPPKEPLLEAGLDINPPELAPNSTIELRFPSAMIPRNLVGTVDADSPLIIEPALAGQFEWTSSRSGNYKLTQPPKFNTSYKFKLKPGLKDLEGKSLSAEQLGETSSASFRIIDQYPKWFDQTNASRASKFLFEFNDSVNPAEAAKAIQFNCGETRARVSAKARHATGRDFQDFYAEPQATWAEEVSAAKPAISPEGARLSAIIVEPESPLPVGKRWALQIAASLPNLAGHGKLAAGETIDLGEVKPFLVDAIRAHTPFDRDYFISVSFNKPLVETRDDEDDSKRLAELAKKWANAIRIEPPVEITAVHADWRSLSVHGKFALNQEYKIRVEPAVVSADGLTLQAAAEKADTFKPNPPYVAVPSFVNAQLASGSGEYEFSAANVKQVRVRAKRLTGPELIEAIEKYQPYEETFHASQQKKAAFKPESIDAYPGALVFDQTFPISKPLDKSELIKLKWPEVLGKAKAGPLFIEIEGAAAEGAGDKNVIAQTLVEFTDFGIVQKTTGREALVFVVSLKTGKPVPRVRLTLVDGDRKLIGYGHTDVNGVAAIRGADPKFVIAEKGDDVSAVSMIDSGGGIPLWHFGINTAWKSPWEPQRRTFVFSDRPVYKPGETAHFKAFTRTLIGDDLSIDPSVAKGRLVVRDPRYRVVIDKPVTFSAAGSWNDDLTLPTGPTGWYSLSLQLPSQDEDEEYERGGGMIFRVDEYRPNTFEVRFDNDKLNLQPDRIKLPLHANYFMGKALSRAKVNWSAFRETFFSRPAGYEEFHFGDAPRWAGYGQDRDARGRYAGDEDEAESWDAFGNAILSEEGTAELEMPVPPPDRASLPQRVRVEAEVIDINQQTITSSTEFIVPGAEFILGLRGPQYFGTAGKELPFDMVAISPEGKPAVGEVAANVKIERQTYHTIKIATAGGGSTMKDQVVLQQELTQTVTLKPAAAGQAPSATINFKPARGGAYFITAESVDPKGRKLLSRLPFYVIGGGEFPWAMEDGSKINLQPDKTELKPGEEASIVVKTPIAGTALVTVERNKIHRQFITKLSPDNPMIKVPVQDAESPNVFVSVIVVRGADASPKQHKMPEYKVGYCELKVNSVAKNLAVEIKPDRAEVKPGETVAITGTVKDASGQPQAGSEVTLFAVDEGVLSLMRYKTPNPRELFRQPFALAIKNWTSIDGVLPEDFAERVRGNKGFLVGADGEKGDEQLIELPMRKNFVTTPLWIATAMSDAAGKVTASIKAPDNLTRYRIMAVAAAGADRFGNGESAFVINKPLMIEPVVPRFARLSDELLIKAVVHNTTPHSGEVEVELKLDDKASLITEERPFVLTSLTTPKRITDGKSEKRVLPIKAGETASVAFPIKIEKLGTAKWSWSARSTNWPDGAEAVSDGTESTFEVNHPMPELREVRYVRLDAKTPIDNLIKDVNPQILEGNGTVEFNASTSRLSELRDALDYVLTYPYGCVEQVSSATMPWLALGGFNDLFPGQIDPAKAKPAIQSGASRLLQMATDQGGLAYWPGGQEPSPWASAYGGFVLMKCRDAGAEVPKEVVDGLLDYLSKSLRNLDDEKDPYALTNAALALYTLAKGGKAEPAYENLLYGKRDIMPEVARLFVALAMCVHDAPEPQIKDLIGWRPKPPPEVKKPASAKGKTKTVTKAKPAPRPAPAPVWTHWWGNTVNKSLRLLVYAHLGLKQEADDLMTQILQARTGRGEWGNTFTNSWTLLSMAGYERSVKSAAEPLDLRVKWDAQDVPLHLPSLNSTAKAAFVLNPTLAAQPLTVEIPEGRSAFARIEARSWLPRSEFAGENKGYGITRVYSKLMPDGAHESLDDLRVGDMVLVTLEIEVGGGDRYIAIDDPLPAVFEAVNPAFDTQKQVGSRAADGLEPWFCDFREIRADRALFFTDHAPGKGKFSLAYLARVIAEGDTIAPPARIEAMYEPSKYGLSATQRLRTLPSASGKGVAVK